MNGRNKGGTSSYQPIRCLPPRPIFAVGNAFYTGSESQLLVLKKNALYIAKITLDHVMTDDTRLFKVFLKKTVRSTDWLRPSSVQGS